MEFKNPDVAAKYSSSWITDPVVHLPGRKATGFKCNLSQVTLAQADKLYACSGQNLIQLKQVAAQAVSTPAIEATETSETSEETPRKGKK